MLIGLAMAHTVVCIVDIAAQVILVVVMLGISVNSVNQLHTNLIECVISV